MGKGFSSLNGRTNARNTRFKRPSQISQRHPQFPGSPETGGTSCLDLATSTAFFRPPTLTPDQSTSHKLLSTTLLKPLFRTGKLGLSGSLAPFVKKASQYN